ncbi:hypothetical protein Nepgr_027562 [Nepenthes gracilis]|uniref:Uncharacterized protein n=1 Tax=Nepenthes gracilis TaxID=150966 RepID=A0AAD3TAJ8_NEPGR|nr:hypothetical protein Nepgr_027562 [Nepenthes gracilis]
MVVDHEQTASTDNCFSISGHALNLKTSIDNRSGQDSEAWWLLDSIWSSYPMEETLERLGADPRRSERSKMLLRKLPRACAGRKWLLSGRSPSTTLSASRAGRYIRRHIFAFVLSSSSQKKI